MALGDEIAKGMEIRGELRKAGADFVQTELEASLTFAEAALSAGNDVAKRERARANARKGYDTLERFRQRFPVPPSAERKFDERLRELKAALKSLGETGL
jgi:hypothetical protein